MPRTRIAAAALALAAIIPAVALADMAPKADDPVSLRKQMMKNTGAAMGMAGKMAKGEMAFDPVVAEAAFRIMSASAAGFGHVFPEGSMTDASEAGPKIWSDAAGFEAAVVKFLADTTMAVDAKPQDKDAFMKVFGQVASNCKGCHQDYRVKKN